MNICVISDGWRCIVLCFVSTERGGSAHCNSQRVRWPHLVTWFRRLSRQRNYTGFHLDQRSAFTASSRFFAL